MEQQSGGRGRGRGRGRTHDKRQYGIGGRGNDNDRGGRGGEPPRDWGDLSNRSAKGGVKGGGGAVQTGGRFGDGNESGGFITSIKDNFGFIEPSFAPAGSEHFFFHFSAWTGRTDPVVGAEVSFTVEPDRRTGRDAAQRVTLLDQGTLPSPVRPGIAVRAVVQRELIGGRGGDGYGGRLALVRLDAAAGEGAAPVELVPFDARACERGVTYLVGDLVEVLIAETPAPSSAVASSAQRSATSVRLLERGGGRAKEMGAKEPGGDPAKEVGKVISLKDKFGFIRSASATGELFFHFSEAPKPATNLGGGRAEPLAVGDEVSYTRITDARSGKIAATRLELLLPGTVEFEAFAPNAVRGVVTRACLAGGGGRYPRTLSRADKAQHGGLIRIVDAAEGAAAAEMEAEEEPGGADAAADGVATLAMEDAAASSAASSAEGAAAAGGRAQGGEKRGGGGAPTFSFGLDDVDEPLRSEGLFVGDMVTFYVSTDRATGDTGAGKVKLEAARWQRGFVASVREGFGFIKAAASSSQIFFPLSALPNARMHAEVEYRKATDPRTNKPIAALVRELPPGSIVIEWVGAQRWLALLTAAPTSRAQHGRSPQKPSGCRDAPGLARLVLVIPEGSTEEAGGLPVRLDPGQRFFPFPGDGSPGGAVPEGPAAAALVTLLAAAADPSQLGSSQLGSELPLFADAPLGLAPGDLVSVQLVVSAASGAPRLTRAGLVEAPPGDIPGASSAKRERGIVTCVKEQFGFLRSEEREGSLFFHFSQLPARTHQLNPGDEFDFVVSAEGGAAAGGKKKAQRVAVRLRTLPSGSLTFEDVLVEEAAGVFVSAQGEAALAEEAEEEGEEGEEGEEEGGAEGAGEGGAAPAKAASSGAARGGVLVRLNEPFEGATITLAPNRQQMNAHLRGALPALGSLGSCKLARRRRDGALVLVDVHPAPLAGVVKACHGATGVLRATAALPAQAVMAAASARAAAAAAEASASGGASGLQDLVGKNASWGRGDDATDASVQGAALGAAPAEQKAAAAPVYMSAGQSPFENAAPTVKTTNSRLAELAAAHGDGRAQQVPFSFSDSLFDPKKEARIGAGDEVEFVLCADPKTLQLVARRVRQTKEAVGAEPAEYVKRQLDPAKQTRFAKGPDGTRGFGIGRGKPLASPTAQAAEA